MINPTEMIMLQACVSAEFTIRTKQQVTAALQFRLRHNNLVSLKRL